MKFRQNWSDIMLWRTNLTKQSKHFASRLQLEPDKEKHVVNLARFLSGINKNQEAEQELTAFIAKYPDNMEARFALADFYLSRRQEGKAFKTLKEIVDKESTGPNGLKAKDRMAAMHACPGTNRRSRKIGLRGVKRKSQRYERHPHYGIIGIG